MPSGSHSGGSRGGSHSSGGSRSSSSYSSSRSSSGSHGSRGMRGSSLGSHWGHSHHHHRPMRIWWGRTYVVTNGASSIYAFGLVFFFLLVFTILMGTVAMGSINNEIAIIESDYRYYCDMIDASYDNPLRQVDAKITGKFQNEDCDKWYLTYSIYTYLGEELEGFTYSMYTFDEIKKFRIDDTIKCAVDSDTITLRTDSVNLDYKGALDRDGEYINAKKSKTTTTVVICIFAAVDFVLLVCLVKAIKKGIKAEKESKNMGKVMGAASAPVARCPYCGTKSKGDSRKCSNCGASIK